MTQRTKNLPPLLSRLRDTSQYFTRRMLCERAGIEEGVFRIIEKNHPQDVRACGRNSAGWVFYDPDLVEVIKRLAPPYVQRFEAKRKERQLFKEAREVARSAALKDGRIVFTDPSDRSGLEAARVFELLEQGVSLTQIVIDTRIPPTHVQELARTHATLKGGFHLSLDVLERLRVIAPEGTVFAGPEDVYKAYRFALRRLRCPRCRQAERAEACVPCLCEMATKGGEGGEDAEDGVADAEPEPSAAAE